MGDCAVLKVYITIAVLAGVVLQLFRYGFTYFLRIWLLFIIRIVTDILIILFLIRNFWFSLIIIHSQILVSQRLCLILRIILITIPHSAQPASLSLIQAEHCSFSLHDLDRQPDVWVRVKDRNLIAIQLTHIIFLNVWSDLLNWLLILAFYSICILRA